MRVEPVYQNLALSVELNRAQRGLTPWSPRMAYGAFSKLLDHLSNSNGQLLVHAERRGGHHIESSARRRGVLAVAKFMPDLPSRRIAFWARKAGGRCHLFKCVHSVAFVDARAPIFGTPTRDMAALHRA